MVGMLYAYLKKHVGSGDGLHPFDPYWGRAPLAACVFAQRASLLPVVADRARLNSWTDFSCTAPGFLDKWTA